MSRLTSRRRFLQTSAAIGSGYFVASGLAAAPSKSPNEKLNIGVIGAAGRGMANTNGCMTENFVALCDVNEKNLLKAQENIAKAKEKLKEKPVAAKTYRDWRKMLDQKDIDAVIVSTTDHTHALASVWAMRRGKHVYCEKPLAHSVHEARIMQDTYKKAKVATQMGTQIHATDNYRRVVELVRAEPVGPIKEVHVWCGRIGPCRPRATETPPVPPELNWDLWLGPAPYRDYHPSYMPGCTTWEQRWDFGNGCLGDMGSHLIDLPFWALDLRDPLTAEAEGEVRSDESYPPWLKAKWEHPASGKRGPLTLFWYDGVQQPKIEVPGEDLKKLHKGILFVGTKGMILADYGYVKLLPKEKFQDYKAPEQSIPKSAGHYQEWIQGCKTGSPTLCNFDYSGKLVEHNLLGAVAFRVNKKLQWDPAKLEATNCPEAARFIRREYRQGWVLEG